MNNLTPTFLEDLGFTTNTCPDSINPDYFSINENHVVSRDKYGNIDSIFGDVLWNFTHYTSREVKLNFSKFYKADKTIGKEVYRDLKLCCLYLLYFPNFKSIRTVESASRNLFIFADNAIKKEISFSQSLADISILKEIESNKKLSDTEKYRKLANILSSFNRLGKLSAIFPSFNFSPCNETYNFALKHSQLFKKSRRINQTPVIPTRLFSELITECSHILSSVFTETSLIKDGRKLLLHEAIDILLKNTITICLDSPKNNQINILEGIDYIPSDILKARRWSIRFSKNQERYWNALKPFGINNFKDIKTYFSYFFSCGRAITQIFTGMRFEEASNVPFNGFKCLEIEGEKVYFIQSWTTKLESESARFASWITSSLFVDFNKAIQTLVRIFYSKYKAIHIDDVDQSMHPLFPALVGQSLTNPFFIYPTFQKFSTKAGWRPYEQFTYNVTRFYITEDDFSELKKQDLVRDWQNQGFRIGELFHFASHQFRRSLVVYAARSGLVSLPSLQSNLQHLTQTMTAYYAKDASYAENFILDIKDESQGIKSLKSFVNEFRDEIFDAEIDAIWEGIVETEDILFGGYGSFLQKKKDSGDMPIIFDSRDSIRKAVKKGKLAYKSTPLGGCCSITPCEKSSFTSITACILCENAVFNSISVAKLQKTKHNLERKLLLFDNNSPFALQTQKEIEIINKALFYRINVIEVKNRNV